MEPGSPVDFEIPNPDDWDGKCVVCGDMECSGHPTIWGSTTGGGTKPTRQSGWQAAYIMPLTEATAITGSVSSSNTGNVWINPQPTPYTITPSLPLPTPPLDVDLSEWGADLCPDGHTIDPKTIKVRDDETYGHCENCTCRVIIPRVVGGLAFERAGSAVGRAMTLQEGDEEKIGELLAELCELQRTTEAEIVRHKRALGMIDIAKGIVEQRAAGSNAPVS